MILDHYALTIILKYGNTLAQKSQIHFVLSVGDDKEDQILSTITQALSINIERKNIHQRVDPSLKNCKPLTTR